VRPSLFALFELLFGNWFRTISEGLARRSQTLQNYYSRPNCLKSQPLARFLPSTLLSTPNPPRYL